MEPASIVGLAFGSIGMLMTLYNAAHTIYKEGHKYKEYMKDICPLMGRVLLISLDLEKWRRTYGLYEDLDDGLPRILWGDRGVELVKSHLGTAWEQSKSIHARFAKKYCDPMQYLEKKIELRNAQVKPEIWSAAAFEKEQFELLKYMKKELGRIGRLKRALFYADVFEQDLVKAETAVRILFSVSKGLFDDLRGLVLGEEDSRKLAQKTSRQYALVSLSDASDEASMDVLTMLRSVAEFELDFELDHWGNTQLKPQEHVLAQQLVQKGFPYDFRVIPTSTTLAGTEQLRLRAEWEDVCAESSTLHASFNDALDSWKKTQGSPLRVRNAMKGNTLKISIEAVEYRQSETLRQRLLKSERKINREKPWYSEFRYKERIKLACKISETALLLAKTDWLCTLCSCRVQCAYVESLADDFVHRIRLSKITHVNAADAAPSAGSSDREWCEREFVDMHFRRLGILLIEIAIGFPLASAYYSEHDRKVAMFLNDDDLAPSLDGICRPTWPQTILQDIAMSSGFGVEYSEAVSHCLRQGKKPGELSRTELTLFYEHVVYPLQCLWNAEAKVAAQEP